MCVFDLKIEANAPPADFATIMFAFEQFACSDSTVGK